MFKYRLVSEQIPSILCLSKLIYLLWLDKWGQNRLIFHRANQFGVFIMQNLGSRTIAFVVISFMKFEVCLNYDCYLQFFTLCSKF